MHELLWFLAGDTNVKYLNDHGVRIWDKWEDAATGELGPVYCRQWRLCLTPDGGTIDQIANVVSDIRRLKPAYGAWTQVQPQTMGGGPFATAFAFSFCGGLRSGHRYSRATTSVNQ